VVERVRSTELETCNGVVTGIGKDRHSRADHSREMPERLKSYFASEGGYFGLMGKKIPVNGLTRVA